MTSLQGSPTAGVLAKVVSEAGRLNYDSREAQLGPF